MVAIFKIVIATRDLSRTRVSCGCFRTFSCGFVIVQRIVDIPKKDTVVRRWKTSRQLDEYLTLFHLIFTKPEVNNCFKLFVESNKTTNKCKMQRCCANKVQNFTTNLAINTREKQGKNAHLCVFADNIS